MGTIAVANPLRRRMPSNGKRPFVNPRDDGGDEKTPEQREAAYRRMNPGDEKERDEEDAVHAQNYLNDEQQRWAWARARAAVVERDAHGRPVETDEQKTQDPAFFQALREFQATAAVPVQQFQVGDKVQAKYADGPWYDGTIKWHDATINALMNEEGEHCVRLSDDVAAKLGTRGAYAYFHPHNIQSSSRDIVEDDEKANDETAEDLSSIYLTGSR